MSAQRSRIEELARAVAEGARVDWDAALEGAADAAERRAIQQLRAVEELVRDSRATLGQERTVTIVRDAAGTVFAAGQVLGQRYRIQGLLGRGGMGEVWLAVDLKLRVDVALKSLRKERFQDERMIELMRREVRSAREVVSPNVSRIFDLVELDGQELVSMEYIDGQTLFQMLRERGPLELREATEIASQFLAGLEAIHAAGLVHRDVKPENIMLTRSGRVVLMDFGLAKPETGQGGTVAGTPAYMAPEQLAGEPLDARADIFAAGIVLAEMISAEGIKDRESRHSLQRGVREDPPRLPDSPWRPVLKRAVAKEKQQRYPSAHELVRALEAITLRVEGAEDVRPYPGLATFTEADAEYFFGRELEVESMWKKLRRPHLLGLIGPSGAGKSSFIRAGLLPAMPTGWRHVLCHPGDAPLQALAGALVSELAGDTEAMTQVVRFDKPDVAVALFSRWRKKHDEALLIVDQFEELFTLNPPEVQERFSELLGRLALEADVRVLLSMRDDFLVHCSGQPSLAPILSELTALRRPTGSALRRAVVQPAAKCGYRFEDDRLVEEILAEVEDERGALPMLAFAAARLWDRRDRDSGLLTREAYEEIGGVGGALAQHADATLERIGTERIPIVRELFRNLVTAQGTRAVRDRQELLSVFDAAERQTAEEILNRFIDARLLTSYEMRAADGEDSGRQRVEIIHESLLSAWPRLVRWRTQEADGAQLRDQLRQAAQMWEDRGRSDDLLWSGTAYGEYELWRERYPGGLSETEEAFGRAMVHHAQRRKRRRRLAVGAVIASLLVVLGIVSWSGLEQRRARLRAEANNLLTLGRSQLEKHPTAALAYAIASLETADTVEAREFAQEVLWQGPTAFSENVGGDALGLFFSPDGTSLLAGRADPRLLRLWHQDGAPVSLPDDQSFLAFSGEGRFYSTRGNEDQGIDVRSLPDGRLVRNLEIDLDGLIGWWPAGEAFLAVRMDDGRALLRRWPLDGSEPVRLGHLPRGATWPVAVDPNGRWMSYAVEREPSDGDAKKDVYLIRLDQLETSSPRRIDAGDDVIPGVYFHPDGQWIAIRLQPGNRIELRSLPGASIEAPPSFHVEAVVANEQLGFAGHWVAAPQGDPGTSLLWDLSAPPGAEPLVLRRGDIQGTWALGMHPAGDWVAVSDTGHVSLWPLSRTYPRVLREGGGQAFGVVFDPAGEWVASTNSRGTIRIWPIDGSGGQEPYVLHESDTMLYPLAISPDGRYLASSGFDGRVVVVPVHGGAPKVLRDFGGGSAGDKPTFDPTGRRLASATAKNGVRICDLESEQIRVLGPGNGRYFFSLDFVKDGRLLSVQQGNVIRLLDPDRGTDDLLWDGTGEPSEVSRRRHELERSGPSCSLVAPDGRHLLVTHVAPGTDFFAPDLRVYDLEAGEWLEALPSSALCGESACTSWAWHPSGEILVTGSRDGTIRVASLDSGEVHLLYRHEGIVWRLAVHPDGNWIASAGNDGTVRLWPMPEGRPLHTLPYEELLDRLRSLTNYRVVPDERSSSGYRVTFDRLPAWDEVPTW